MKDWNIKLRVANKLVCRWLLRVLMISLISTVRPAAANDNLLAHALFKSGEYSQAGEIFTDPAWKGVALYKSGQWWRAAEAFVRANDPQSAYNLGNCYVKLGYYELALDSYQRALSLNPELADAQHNADVMRALLALNSSENDDGSTQPSGEQIEQIETEEESSDPGSSEGGTEDSESSQSSQEQSSSQGNQSVGPQNDAQAGKGGEAGDNKLQTQNPDGGGSVNGMAGDQETASRPSGGSESDTQIDDSLAAGMRASLESEQATTQWLNQIEHDSQLFLKRRISLEQKRRRIAGSSAPEGGSSW